eukprot:2075286-Rhodomonas_salina.3
MGKMKLSRHSGKLVFRATSVWCCTMYDAAGSNAAQRIVHVRRHSKRVAAQKLHACNGGQGSTATQKTHCEHEPRRCQQK